MKVLQINAVYGHGSTGTIVRDIESICSKNELDCYVASPDKNVLAAKRGYVIGNMLDHKLHALLCRINGKQAYFSHIPTISLCRYIDRIKPDIVHLHNLHSNYVHLNLLLKHLARKNIRTIITLHDCWFYTGGCFHYTSVECQRWKYKCGHCPKKRQDTPSIVFDRSSQILSDRQKYLLAIPHLYITSVSKWIASEAKKSFLNKTPNYIILNGIDMDVFQPMSSDIRKKFNLEGKYIILGPSSKWLSRENRNVLFSFSKLLKSDEILLLFGDCKTDVDLPKNIILFGYTRDRGELAKLYTCADIFVNVSREDSLSLINIEAQACCTPVVTFNQTGPKETVNEIDSFSVPVGDTDALYEKVRLIRSQGQVKNFNCRKFVNEQFEQLTNYKKYIELYKSIMK